MTLEELKESIEELGFDDNAKVCVIITRNDDGTYDFSQVVGI